MHLVPESRQRRRVLWFGAVGLAGTAVGVAGVPVVDGFCLRAGLVHLLFLAVTVRREPGTLKKTAWTSVLGLLVLVFARVDLLVLRLLSGVGVSTEATFGVALSPRLLEDQLVALFGLMPAAAGYLAGGFWRAGRTRAAATLLTTAWFVGWVGAASVKGGGLFAFWRATVGVGFGLVTAALLRRAEGI